MALVNCQVEVVPSRLHQFFQEKYVLLNYINFEGGKRNICCNCVSNIKGGGEDKFKKVGDRTVYGNIQLEED